MVIYLAIVVKNTLLTTYSLSYVPINVLSHYPAVWTDVGHHRGLTEDANSIVESLITDLVRTIKLVKLPPCPTIACIVGRRV